MKALCKDHDDLQYLVAQSLGMDPHDEAQRESDVVQRVIKKMDRAAHHAWQSEVRSLLSGEPTP